jgi:hypothetical protein
MAAPSAAPPQPQAQQQLPATPAAVALDARILTRLRLLVSPVGLSLLAQRFVGPRARERRLLSRFLSLSLCR